MDETTEELVGQLPAREWAGLQVSSPLAARSGRVRAIDCARAPAIRGYGHGINGPLSRSPLARVRGNLRHDSTSRVHPARLRNTDGRRLSALAANRLSLPCSAGNPFPPGRERPGFHGVPAEVLLPCDPDDVNDVEPYDGATEVDQ